MCSLRYGRWRHILAISLAERSLTLDLRDLESESFSLGDFLAPARSRAEKSFKNVIKMLNAKNYKRPAILRQPNGVP